MAGPIIDDKMRLKRMVAFSRDIILVSLDKDVLPFLIEDTKIRNVFIEYSYDLTERVKNDTLTTLNIINSGEEEANLAKEGLTGGELRFKYTFFNSIIDTINSNISPSPDSDNTSSRLPNLDTYEDVHIMNMDNN